ncbi:trifunctional transcriptional regulator/proline dehydrogenase/L-glutamate gamma-semialdehyde dehydrogenase [Imbroritus primus]|uniref:trifunctional transcriptional regulator/proline dehydrogenase/L-glutamate gamma-semialdehyde dehydrogenase n=1 Tax=Imbroritus primus TaxID=3058603 RepID=UPI003D1622CA
MATTHLGTAHDDAPDPVFDPMPGSLSGGASSEESHLAPEPPFLAFAQGIQPQGALRAAITDATRRPEPECLPWLLEQARLPPPLATRAITLATQLAARLREAPAGSGRETLVQGLIQEFSLSSQEGIALMCLAEALLRIPDAATRDALIRDKISHGNWQSHLGHSRSLFVNAAAWGLLLTGKLVATHTETGLSNALARLIGKSGEPVIRKGVDMAMRLMGEQFVTGETIDEALAHAQTREAQGFRYSFDMLGEAAMTAADAQRYCDAYAQAIHAIGRASAGRGVLAGPGISIKLSALHPRYSRAQATRVMAELYPRLRDLAELACRYDIGLNIDAEEAERLELSLDLLERLCFEPALARWQGIGFVVQAYQKRCPFVIDYLIDLARRSGHRLMVRLVKGAYWDSEIKRAQVDGLEGYPVYTRKVYTDISYLACARKLLAAPDAVYPQFATHNAHTVAAVCQMAGPDYTPGQYEFQCLHGMGEPLYEQIVSSAADDAGGRASIMPRRPCRIYAPVGTHETLLAYLVRRLLENGANTSFVNRVADTRVPLAELVADPVASVERLQQEEGQPGLPHPRIPLPRDLFGCARRNSAGLDLASEQRLASLASSLFASVATPWLAMPLLADDEPPAGMPVDVRNPADHRDRVGTVIDATPQETARALAHAEAAGTVWQTTLPAARAAVLEHAADLFESQMPVLMGLIVREAGKSLANAIAEVREAVDFLRYYAAQVRATFSNDTHRPLGPVVCISPWNFPLAIFTGQISAALAAGNTVLAKPAEQTPLIAAQAVRILHAAGVPRGALQLVPGPGETIGAALVADARIRGVMFTGSTTVARLLQRSLAGRLDAHGRPLPLIAETGGQNALIVDSSALAEQVVADVLASAFDSAGQRCSALRVLCLQQDIAAPLLAMLKGAMAELRVGNPDRLEVDVGPVIDAEARDAIQQHIDTMRVNGRAVYQAATPDTTVHGTFIPPTLIEIDRIDELQREVFGPVLHVLRYPRTGLDLLIGQINATGYGLTLGLHTRIDETITQVTTRASVGNQYVNRNIIGAVVGVQPFGGEGLSGTGPKAGGPLYLLRLLSACPLDAAVQAVTAAGVWQRATQAASGAGRWSRWRAWLQQEMPMLAGTCERFADHALANSSTMLTGPTGERNVYTLLPRQAVLCLAEEMNDRLLQLSAVLAIGSRAVWPDTPDTRALHARLPPEIGAQVQRVPDWTTAAYDVALYHGDADRLRAVCEQLAQRSGPIVTVHGYARGDTGIALERLLREHALSINTAAAGGNASLMTIG